MKILLTTVILWAGLFLSNCNAQKSKGDTLNILSQEELLIKIATPNIHRLKHSTDIYNLISEFKTNLGAVIEQIPDYDIFTISYIKNQSLRVEEVQGIVKYQVENGQMEKAHNQSVAHLKQGDLQVFFYVNEIEDLLSRKYETMIKSALAMVKKGPKSLQKIYSPINEFFYSYSKGEMVDGYEKIKFKNRFGLVFGGTIGFFKSKPIYEITQGIGYSFGVKNNRMIYLYGGYLYQYNDLTDTHSLANIYGLGFRLHDLTSGSFTFFKNDISQNGFEDINFRWTTTIYPTKGISVSTHLYFSNIFDDDKQSGFFPGVSFGFGF